MWIIAEKVDRSDLLDSSDVVFDGEMVKAVVDIDRHIVAVDAELHADLEHLLLDNGSNQDFLWGINIYPREDDDDLVEFDSLINIRPRQNNRSRDVEDTQIRERINEVVSEWIR